MIYKNKCLFLFKGDFPEGVSFDMTKLSIESFLKHDMDMNKFKNYVIKSNNIMYVDSDHRLVKIIKSDKVPIGHMFKY